MRIPEPSTLTERIARRRSIARSLAAAWAVIMFASSARASGSSTIDSIANVIAWVSLIFGPIILIGLNYFVNIHPERIARKRRHPQLPAIKALIMMSSLFGGILWPIAWIWASSKPVLYKLAYGTDVDEEIAPEPDKKDKELAELRAAVAELRAQLGAAGHQPRTN